LTRIGRRTCRRATCPRPVAEFLACNKVAVRGELHGVSIRSHPGLEGISFEFRRISLHVEGPKAGLVEIRQANAVARSPTDGGQIGCDHRLCSSGQEPVRLLVGCAVGKMWKGGPAGGASGAAVRTHRGRRAVAAVARGCPRSKPQRWRSSRRVISPRPPSDPTCSCHRPSRTAAGM
jgi:hypothetical protein